jgi:cell wall surface anchor signal protein
VKPETPAKPAEEVKPETPTKPVEEVKPETPTTPEKDVKSETPAKPENNKTTTRRLYQIQVNQHLFLVLSVASFQLLV